MGIAQQHDRFVDLKRWMDTQYISTISDLSSWHSSGRWAGWRTLETPDHLKMDFNQLQSLLQGSLPIHINLKDARSWGNTGISTVKAGYNAIQNNNRKRGHMEKCMER